MAEDWQHLDVPRRRSQNIVHLLIDRENAIDRRYYLHSRSSKAFCMQFFKCIPPNLSISNIDKPTNYIRKFSPDGKYLICFSKDQQSLENYKFLGIANSSALLYKWRDEYVPPDSSKGLGKHIRHNVFNQLFQLNWSIQLTTFLRPLYREFSIFTGDGIFVIVASYMTIQEENLPSYYTLNPINNTQFEHDLNWYRFYMVKLSDGTVHDTLEYTYDFINLSHNHGVCIYENKMAVVSLFRQLIYIVHLSEGTFINLFTIGHFYHGTDECLCRCVPEYRNECILLGKRFGGLKQKLLISLYKNTLKCPAKDQRRTLLQQFYRRFKVYQSLEIHKIQFIDGSNLLIRFDNTKQQNLTLDTLEAIKLYVVYNIANNEMVSIYSEKSKTLLRILRDFYDDFRNMRSIFTGRAPSSTSNNVFLKIAQTRLIEACPYGESEAAYRLLPQLPISVQSCSVSPYMDLYLFQYDDHLISALERPRLPTYEPILFKDRETHITLFRIYPGLHEPFVNENQQSRCCSSKRLISFIFHPLEPFIISVQKLSNRYVTNFHIRNEGTYVPI